MSARIHWLASIAITLSLAAGCARAAPSETSAVAPAMPADRATAPSTPTAPTPSDPSTPPIDRAASGDVASALYPAEAVMDHQAALALSPEQTRAIQDDLRATQSALLELDWRLRGEQERLRATLSADPVDETAATRDAETVAATESAIEVVHLRLLVRIKNRLTPTQRTTLDRLGAHARSTRAARGD